jgi:hypothetical protein
MLLSLVVTLLALSACGATRHVANSGCTAELRFHGVSYCAYGDVTRTSKYRPVHPVGEAQPWHDGSAIKSRQVVPVEGFNSVSATRVIAVTEQKHPHRLVLYVVEFVSPQTRQRLLTAIRLSNAL